MIKPFEMEHLTDLALLPAHQTMLTDNLESFGVLAQNRFLSTVTSRRGHIVLGILGVVPVYPGVGEVFILPTTDVARHPKEFFKSVCKELRRAAGMFDRIRALGADDPKIMRWLKRLGFERQGAANRAGLEGQSMWELKC